MIKLKNLLWSAPIATIAIAGLMAPAQAVPESTWDSLAQCESGGNWGTNTGNGFSGGLQFTPSTWAAFGGSGSPQNASKAEQIRVGENVLAGQGWGAWPACSASLGLSGGGGGYIAAQSQNVTPDHSNDTLAKAPIMDLKQPPAPFDPNAHVATPAAPTQAPAPAVEYVTPSVAPVVENSVPAQSQAPSTDTYTVVKGDTLSKIAQKLGISGGWERLFELNKGILSNPNIIEIGQILRLA